MKKQLKIRLGGNKQHTVTGSRFPNGTQTLVPVVDIRQGVIITEDDRYLKILEVLPTNFYLKSVLEQQSIIQYMAGYLKIAPPHLQIVVRTCRADIDAYCEQMQRYYDTETNGLCRAMIYEDAQLVNYLATTEAVTRKFYLIYPYEGQSSDFDEIVKKLNDIAQTAYQYLDYCGLEVLQHEQYDAFTLRTLYTALQKHTPSDLDFDAILSHIGPVYGEETDGVDTLDEVDAVGILTVQDVLAPTEADTSHKGYLTVDGVYHAYLYVSGYGYPTETGLAWLSPLTELGEGISLSFFLDKKPREQVLQKIAKTTMFHRSRMREIEDVRADYEELDDAISSGMYIKDRMNRDGEDFWYMHTLIEVTAWDDEMLEQRIRQVQNRSTSMGMRLRRADWCHEKGFVSMLPLCKLDRDIELKSRRNVLTTGAAAAFPFSSYELCDDKGILLGLNLHNKSVVILDNYNADIYSNGNMAIFGTTGAGKTYTLLLMAMRLRMCGIQVIIIAPEKGFEYRGACKALGGQYIKLSRGSSDRINIMEIRRKTLDIDALMEGNEQRNDSVMMDVVQNIHTHLKLCYPAMSPEEGYLLNAAVIECYAEFGITRDNRSLINADGHFKAMPDLSHLYPHLLTQPKLRNVAMIVKDLVDSGLAGQTNVDLNSRFVVLDTSSAREEDMVTATHSAMVFVSDEMSRSRTRKKAVLGDELWVVAGKEGNEQAADFVIRLVKTIRGYGGIFISATQNVIDYFALRDGKFGDSVLNNSRLKLLLQMEEAEALKLQEKLGLSDEEVMQIVRCNRGQGLLCAGKNRIVVEIRSSTTEYDLITTNREDLEKKELKENGHG